MAARFYTSYTADQIHGADSGRERNTGAKEDSSNSTSDCSKCYNECRLHKLCVLTV